MSMSIGRPVSPTVMPSAPTPTKVSQAAASTTPVQTQSAPQHTQESYGAVGQSVVGKTSETVNPSQGGQQIKQGIDQVDGEQLQEKGQTLMESPMVKQEFSDGSSALPKLPPPTPPDGLPPPPPPVKVSSVPPPSGGASISTDTPVGVHQNLRQVSQHQVLNLEKGDTAVTESSRSIVLKDKGSAFAPERLTAKATLEIVGHGAKDGSTLGGQTPLQLAKTLKRAGITQLAVLDLKSCHSERFKSALEGELKAAGITVGEIRTYKGEIGISRETGKALQGPELQEKQGHDGVLGLLPDTVINAIAEKNQALFPSAKIDSDRVKKIEGTIERNNGVYVSQKSGGGLDWAKAIAVDIIAAKSQEKLKRTDSVERYMFLQVQRPGTCDGNAINDLMRPDFEQLNRPENGLIAVKFEKVLLGENITCHEFAYKKIDKPGFKPECQDVIDIANATRKPYAVCFLAGKVAHSAFQEDGVWHQALKVGDGASHDTATAFFTTSTIEIGNYEPVVIYDPSKTGSKENFIKVWEEQKEIVYAAEKTGQKAREKTAIEDMVVFFDHIIENCEKNPPDAIKSAQKICQGIATDNGLCTKTIDMILVKLESITPKKAEITKIIDYIRVNREF